MKKIKSFILVALLMIVSLIGFTGCGTAFDNVSITASTAEVNLYYSLNEEGKVVADESNSYSFVATVSGLENGQTNSVDYRMSNTEVVRIDRKMLDNGSTEFTIIPITDGDSVVGGSTDITVLSVAGGKEALVRVNVIVRAKSIEPNKDVNFYILKGDSVNLNPNTMLTFSPAKTTQKNVVFSLDGLYSGVTIENNVLSVAENSELSSIKVKAQLLDDFGNFLGIETSMEFVVIKGFSASDIEISRVGDTEKLSQIDLVYNYSKFNTEEFTIYLAEGYNYSIKYTLTNKKIATVEKVDDVTFRMSANQSGYTFLNIEVTLIDYDYTFARTGIKVNVEDVASYVTLNDKESLNVSIFNNYNNGLGEAFKVYVGSFTANVRSFIINISDELIGYVDVVYADNTPVKMLDSGKAIGDGGFDIIPNDTTIYIRAKNLEGGFESQTGIIQFIAYYPLVKGYIDHNIDTIAVNNLSITTKKGATHITAFIDADVDGNKIFYVESGYDATISYGLDSAEASCEGLSIVTENEEIVSYEIVSVGPNGEDLIDKPIIKIKGLKNGVTNCYFKLMNGFISDPFVVRVFTPIKQNSEGEIIKPIVKSDENPQSNHSISSLTYDRYGNLTAMTLVNGATNIPLSVITDPVDTTIYAQIWKINNNNLSAGILYADVNSDKYISTYNPTENGSVKLQINISTLRVVAEDNRNGTVEKCEVVLEVEIKIYVAVSSVSFENNMSNVSLYYENSLDDFKHSEIYGDSNETLYSTVLSLNILPVSANNFTVKWTIVDNEDDTILRLEPVYIDGSQVDQTKIRLVAGKDISDLKMKDGLSLYVTATVIDNTKNTDEESNDVIRSFVKTCRVTLNKQIKVASFNLENVYNNEIYLDNRTTKTFQLQTSIYPQNALNKKLVYKVYNSDKTRESDIITVNDNGLITAVKEGVCVLTIYPQSAVSIGGSNIDKSISKDIVIKVAGGVSVAYEISSAKDLMSIQSFMGDLGYNVKFILKNNIYLNANEEFVPLGYDKAGYAEFKGELDGNGYTIFNLNLSGKYKYNGLFGKINGGIVKNLTIKLLNNSITINNQLNGTESSDEYYYGAVAGFASYGNITNVTVVADDWRFRVNATQQSLIYIGGLTGVSNNQNLINNKSEINLSIQSTSNVSNFYVGGLTGNLSYAQISGDNSVTVKGTISAYGQFLDSYIGGAVGCAKNSGLSKVITAVDVLTEMNNVGGLAGSYEFEQLDSKKVENCVSSGKVYGNDNVGGLIGYANLARSINAINLNIVETFKDYEANEYFIKGNDNVGGLVGLLVGLNNSSTNLSYSYVKVYTTSAKMFGSNNVGGLVGQISNAKVVCCSADINVVVDNNDAIIATADDGNGNQSVVEMPEDVNVGGLFGDAYNITFSTGYAKGSYSVTSHNETITSSIVMGALVGRVKQSSIAYAYTYLTYQNLINAYGKDIQYTTINPETGVEETHNSVFSNLLLAENDSYLLLSINSFVGSGKMYEERDEFDNYWLFGSGYENYNDGMPILYNYATNTILCKGFPSDLDFEINYSKLNSQKITIAKCGTNEQTDDKALVVVRMKESDNFVKIALSDFFKSDNYSKYSIYRSQIIWTTTNSEIARVEGEYLVIYSSGLVTLKATFAGKQELSDEITISIDYGMGDYYLSPNNENIEDINTEQRLDVKVESAFNIYTVTNYKISNVEYKKSNNLFIKFNIASEYEDYITINSLKPSQLNDVYFAENSYIIKTLKTYSGNGGRGIPISYNVYIKDGNLLEGQSFYYDISSDVSQNIIYVAIHEGTTEISSSLDSFSISIKDTVNFTINVVSGVEIDASAALPEICRQLIESVSFEGFEFKDYFTIGDLQQMFVLSKITQENFENQTHYMLHFNVAFLQKYMEINEADYVVFKDKQQGKITFKTKDGNLSTSISVTLLPQKALNIEATHYANGQTSVNNDGLNFNISESPAFVLRPGFFGLLEIDLFPIYSTFDGLEITSSVANNEAISFVQVLKQLSENVSSIALKNTFVRLTPAPETITNGIKLLTYSNVYGSGSNVRTTFDGKIYVRTLISSAVKENTDYTIYLKCYNYLPNGEIDESSAIYKSYEIKIKAQPVVLLSVDLDQKWDKQDNSYLAVAGTSFTVTALVENFSGVIDIQMEYENAGDVSNAMDTIKFNSLPSMTRNGNSVTVDIPYLCEKGYAFKIKATVTKQINYVVESYTESLSFIVTDFTIHGFEEGNSVTSNGEGQMNIRKGDKKTLSAKIIAKKAELDSSNPQYASAQKSFDIMEEQKLLSGYVNNEEYEATKLLLQKIKEKYNSITSKIEALENEINTDNRFWKYSNYANSSSPDITGQRWISIISTSNSISMEEREIIDNSTISFEQTNNVGPIKVVGKTISTSSDTSKYFIRLSVNFIYNNGECSVESELNASQTYKYSSYKIGVKVTSSDTSDHPLPITMENKDLLLNMEENGNYIIMEDLYFTRDSDGTKVFTPISSKFATLDGNNYAVYIDNLTLLSTDKTQSVGFFSEIGENSLVKNLHVVYTTSNYNFNINASDVTTSLVFGMFAGTNNGIVTNCSVNSQLLSNEINPERPTTEINIIVDNNSINTMNFVAGGFVGRNNGKITYSNISSYNDSSINDNAEYASFNINCIQTVGLFAGSNSGLISSSYVKNVAVNNSHYSLDTSRSAGFVVTNSGTINMSYVEGIFPKVENYPSGIFDGNALVDKLLCDSNIQDTAVSIGTDTIAYNRNAVINSFGNVGGFVYSNSGKISDCYSNILMNTQARSAGFAYENSGTIETSYSFSYNLDTVNSVAHTPFVGSNELSEKNNSGLIDLCYYVLSSSNSSGAGTNTNIFFEDDAVEVTTTDLNELDTNAFKGFLFSTSVSSNESPWTWSNARGFGYPRIISADQQNTALRVFNGTLEVEGEIVQYNYEDISIGSDISNPILIRNAEEFVNVFTDDYYYYSLGYDKLKPENLARFANSTEKSVGKYLRIYARLVDDIDLSSVAGSEKLAKLQNTIFAGYLDGNSMKITGISILGSSATSSTVTSLDSFGLFAQIGISNNVEMDGEYKTKQEAIVTETVGKDTVSYQITRQVDTSLSSAIIKNVDFEVEEIADSHASVVGTLAGEIVNASIVNVNVYGDDIVALGVNMVGGIAGRVSENALIRQVTSNISVTSAYITQVEDYDYSGYDAVNSNVRNSSASTDTKISYQSKFTIGTIENSAKQIVNSNYKSQDLKKISYAGGLFGVVDIDLNNYRENSVEYSDLLEDYAVVEKFNKYALNDVKVYDSVAIKGEFAGGLFGYLSEFAFVYNAKFEVSTTASQSIQGYYAAGGIVAQNYGVVDHTVVDAYSLDDDDISESLDSPEINLYPQDVFVSEYKPEYIGGLAGINLGAVFQSYNKLHVIHFDAHYVGGLVGINIDGKTLNTEGKGGFLKECYVTANVFAGDNNSNGEYNNIAGGVVGRYNRWAPVSSNNIAGITALNNWFKPDSYDLSSLLKYNETTGLTSQVVYSDVANGYTQYEKSVDEIETTTAKGRTISAYIGAPYNYTKTANEVVISSTVEEWTPVSLITTGDDSESTGVTAKTFVNDFIKDYNRVNSTGSMLNLFVLTKNGETSYRYVLSEEDPSKYVLKASDDCLVETTNLRINYAGVNMGLEKDKPTQLNVFKTDTTLKEQMLYNSFTEGVWDIKSKTYPILLFKRSNDYRNIESIEDLTNMASTGKYILNNDLYLDSNWDPNNIGYGSFQGKFKANTVTDPITGETRFYQIYNLNITDISANNTSSKIKSKSIGFFGQLGQGAEVSNIIITVGGRIAEPAIYEKYKESNPEWFVMENGKASYSDYYWLHKKTKSTGEDGKIQIVLGELIHEGDYYPNGIVIETVRQNESSQDDILNVGSIAGLVSDCNFISEPIVSFAKGASIISSAHNVGGMFGSVSKTILSKAVVNGVSGNTTCPNVVQFAGNGNEQDSNNVYTLGGLAGFASVIDFTAFAKDTCKVINVVISHIDKNLYTVSNVGGMFGLFDKNDKAITYIEIENISIYSNAKNVSFTIRNAKVNRSILIMETLTDDVDYGTRKVGGAIGAIIGSSSSIGINTISVTGLKIVAQNAKYIAVGGAVGHINYLNSIVDQIYVVGSDTHFSIVTANNLNEFVGGVIGSIDYVRTISNLLSKDFTINNVRSSYSVVGGAIGTVREISGNDKLIFSLYKAVDAGNNSLRIDSISGIISSVDIITNANGDNRIGGLIGEAYATNIRAIKESHSNTNIVYNNTGNKRLIECVGGLVGYVESLDSKRELVISYCYTTGSIDLQKTGGIASNTEVYTQGFGGFVGIANGGNFSNNYALVTIFADAYALSNAKLGGFIGYSQKSSKGNYILTGKDNYYIYNLSGVPVSKFSVISSVKALTYEEFKTKIDTIAKDTAQKSFEIRQNYNFPTVVIGAGSTRTDTLSKIISYYDEIVESESGYLKIYEIGTTPAEGENAGKSAYETLKELFMEDSNYSTEFGSSGTYVMTSDLEINFADLSTLEQQNLIAFFTNFSGRFIGENYKIKLQNFKQPLFTSIETKSLIAGVNVVFEDTITDQEIASRNTIHGSAFIDNNSGLVFNSNVEGSILVNDVSMTSSGFVNTNNKQGDSDFYGRIINSSSRVNYVVDRVGVDISGFVYENKGLIYNCYTIDDITLIDDVDTLRSLAGFVNQMTSGMIYNSYSAVICNQTVTFKLGFSRENNDEIVNCFSDRHAIRDNIDNKKYSKYTAYITLDRASVFQNATQYMFENTKNQKIYLSFDQNEAYQYGYPYLIRVFSNGEPKNYSNSIEEYNDGLRTGTGTKENPYQINHIGRFDWLRTLPTNEHKFAVLTKDLFGDTMSNFTAIGSKNIIDSDYDYYDETLSYEPSVPNDNRQYTLFLDGNNKTISELSLIPEIYEEYQEVKGSVGLSLFYGFIGEDSGVKDLNLNVVVDSRIYKQNSNNSNSQTIFAPLVANLGGGKISNVKVNLEIDGDIELNVTAFGGLVGMQNGGTIEKSAVNVNFKRRVKGANILPSINSSDSFNNTIGMVAGYVAGGTISDIDVVVEGKVNQIIAKNIGFFVGATGKSDTTLNALDAKASTTAIIKNSNAVVKLDLTTIGQSGEYTGTDAFAVKNFKLSSFVGGFVGGLYNGSQLEDNYVKFNRVQNENIFGYAVGGFVGYMDGENSQITKSFTNMSFSGIANFVGGFAGVINNSNSTGVADCFSTGKITLKYSGYTDFINRMFKESTKISVYVGSFAGYNAKNVNSSFTLSDIDVDDGLVSSVDSAIKNNSKLDNKIYLGALFGSTGNKTKVNNSYTIAHIKLTNLKNNNDILDSKNFVKGSISGYASGGQYENVAFASGITLCDNAFGTNSSDATFTVVTGDGSSYTEKQKNVSDSLVFTNNIVGEFKNKFGDSHYPIQKYIKYFRTMNEDDLIDATKVVVDSLEKEHDVKRYKIALDSLGFTVEDLPLEQKEKDEKVYYASYKVTYGLKISPFIISEVTQFKDVIEFTKKEGSGLDEDTYIIIDRSFAITENNNYGIESVASGNYLYIFGHSKTITNKSNGMVKFAKNVVVSSINFVSENRATTFAIYATNTIMYRCSTVIKGTDFEQGTIAGFVNYAMNFVTVNCYATVDVKVNLSNVICFGGFVSNLSGEFNDSGIVINGITGLKETNTNAIAKFNNSKVNITSLDVTQNDNARTIIAGIVGDISSVETYIKNAIVSYTTVKISCQDIVYFGGIVGYSAYGKLFIENAGSYQTSMLDNSKTNINFTDNIANKINIAQNDTNSVIMGDTPINVKGLKIYIGGIVANFNNEGIESQVISIDSCASRLPVRVSGSDSDSVKTYEVLYVGGIAGYVNVSGNNNVIKNSSGLVTAYLQPISDTTTYTCLGGIAGNTISVTIDNCVYHDVLITYKVPLETRNNLNIGGIVGIGKNSTLKNININAKNTNGSAKVKLFTCSGNYNNGPITRLANNMGAIAGVLENSTLTGTIQVGEKIVDITQSSNGSYRILGSSKKMKLTEDSYKGHYAVERNGVASTNESSATTPKGYVDDEGNIYGDVGSILTESHGKGTNPLASGANNLRLLAEIGAVYCNYAIIPYEKIFTTYLNENTDTNGFESLNQSEINSNIGGLVGYFYESELGQNYRDSITANNRVIASQAISSKPYYDLNVGGVLGYVDSLSTTNGKIVRNANAIRGVTTGTNVEYSAVINKNGLANCAGFIAKYDFSDKSKMGLKGKEIFRYYVDVNGSPRSYSSGNYLSYHDRIIVEDVNSSNISIYAPLTFTKYSSKYPSFVDSYQITGIQQKRNGIWGNSNTGYFDYSAGGEYDTIDGEAYYGIKYYYDRWTNLIGFGGSAPVDDTSLPDKIKFNIFNIVGTNALVNNDHTYIDDSMWLISQDKYMDIGVTSLYAHTWSIQAGYNILGLFKENVFVPYVELLYNLNYSSCYREDSVTISKDLTYGMINKRKEEWENYSPQKNINYIPKTKIGNKVNGIVVLATYDYGWWDSDFWTAFDELDRYSKFDKETGKYVFKNLYTSDTPVIKILTPYRGGTYYASYE